MSTQKLSGSCLCGALSYDLEGEPVRFYHCHCSRCRKASGTGHASNLFVSGGSLEWSGDAAMISNYKLPEAKRFSRTFCSRCGGPLPKEIPDMDLVLIPAGTLDVEPALAPQARIFLDSKAEWACMGDDIPCFEQYPG
jgi:hypothetical protein